MATPHIESNIDDIAKKVITAGDPLRCKHIAETYLTDVRIVNNVRNMTAYTGNYKGKAITVFPSGMGIPSMAIYSYELFKMYDVDRIIRVGSCGAYTKDVNLFDTIVAGKTYTDSDYGFVQNGTLSKSNEPSTMLLSEIIQKANDLNTPITIGAIFTSDVFYKEKDDFKSIQKNLNVLAVEMESFALFHNAKLFGKEAATILTVSDSLVTHKATTSEERETGFNKMIILALETI